MDPPLATSYAELIQVVQDNRRTVPLLTGKDTWVRVFLDNNLATLATVRGTIRVRNWASSKTDTVADMEQSVVDPVDNGRIDLKRVALKKALNFLIPSALLQDPGTITVELLDLHDGITGASIPCAGCGGTIGTARLERGPTLRVRAIGIRYAHKRGRALLTAEPTRLDFDLLESWLRRAFPASAVEFSAIVVDADSAIRSCNIINAQLATIRNYDVSSGRDARTHYYALVPDDDGFMRGCAADIPLEPDPSVVASGPTGPTTLSSWDRDGSYGDWMGGHELGHTFGRSHLGSGCGDQPRDSLYPYPAGLLASEKDPFVGLDQGRPNDITLPAAILPGLVWHDVMSYCERQWVSWYTYQHIYERLRQEEALPSRSVAAGPAPAPTPNPTMGDPRRAGEQPAASNRIVDVRPGIDTLLHVVAVINLTKRDGRFRYVTPTGQASQPRTTSQSSRAQIRALDVQNSTLAFFPARLRIATDTPADSDQVATLDEMITIPSATRSLALVLDDKTLDVRVFSHNAPTITDLSAPPAGPGGTTILVRWQASDRDDNRTLTYAVQLTNDGGTTWETLAVGLKRREIEIDRGLIKNPTNARLRVIANDGMRSTTKEIAVPR